MNNSTPFSFEKFNTEGMNEKKLVTISKVTQTKFTAIAPYDKDSPNALSDSKAVDLFSSFTANIIKEETLFIR